MNILIYNKGSVYCPECKHSNLKHDLKRCETYCTICGLVCVDNKYISMGGLRHFDVERNRMNITSPPKSRKYLLH